MLAMAHYSKLESRTRSACGSATIKRDLVCAEIGQRVRQGQHVALQQSDKITYRLGLVEGSYKISVQLCKYPMRSPMLWDWSEDQHAALAIQRDHVHPGISWRVRQGQCAAFSNPMTSHMPWD